MAEKQDQALDCKECQSSAKVLLKNLIYVPYFNFLHIYEANSILGLASIIFPSQ